MTSTIVRPDVRVVGLGLGRTGTMSLKVALEMLGFGPCYHMVELLTKHPEHMGYWTNVKRGIEPTRNIHIIFEEYKSGCDYPQAAFPDEMLKAFPDAKFVLTTRDPQKWKISVENTVRKFTVSLLWLPSFISSLANNFRKMNDEIVWQGQFKGKWEEKAVTGFNEHLEHCKKVIPEKQLLVYRVGEGWEKLCEFLDVPVPDDPFPNVNDSASFNNSGLAWALFSPPVALLFTISHNAYSFRAWLRSLFSRSPKAVKAN